MDSGREEIKIFKNRAMYTSSPSFVKNNSNLKQGNVQHEKTNIKKNKLT